jgi:murein DD-endopeptidase MepM/ murein hydrolase activator NlpD
MATGHEGVVNGCRWLLGCVYIALALSAQFARATDGLEFRGVWRQGGMIVGRVAPAARVTFAGKSVPLSPDGHFVVGLGRDAPATVTLVVSDPLGPRRYRFDVERRSYPVQRVDGVPESTVIPPPEALERIRREQALVDAARAIVSDRDDFLTGFSRPLEGPITGVYGSQRIYNGVPRNPHFGLDIAAPTGTLVRAPAPGVVRLAQPDLYFSGGTLIVDHGQGLTSSFIHLSALLVREGDEVARGDPIARVGATGRANGPHLDWRMNWFDVRLDPALVLQYFPVAGAHTALHQQP